MVKINGFNFDIKSILIAVICSIFSLGLFMLPEAELSAQNYEVNEVYNVEEPCGDDGVDEIIHGKRKGFLGCWGSDSTCKTKCK
ncbi:hypothetical protein [Fodinibius salsisoli]|uniref:NVEALA protein n=1 Tax=Fodinibius salsisoli TaxID=2820877 RepID=A0ABT3PJR2_9BACT|nr:hypothetical protein [Fodinibius salsisoli]MCW9706174.1 hypothetical protein [Fodinibius salsisoli]